MKIKSSSPSKNVLSASVSTKRLEQRAAGIVRAAGQLFLRHGFGGVSLARIVAETGGSYRDIYREFGGKETLFQTAMQHMCTEILTPLRQVLTNPDLQSLPFAEALTRLGVSLLRTLLAPPGLAFHRLMVSEAPRFPKLAKEFYRSGPACAYASVAAFLSARAREEQLAIKDFAVAAAVLVESMVSPLQLKALTGGRVSSADAEKHVRQVVGLFLNGAARRRTRSLVLAPPQTCKIHDF